MAEASVARTISLPFRKSLEISIKSLRVRFFRNLITVMTLVLAIAFLAFIFISGDIATGMLQTGDTALQDALLKAGFDIQHGDTIASSPKERWILFLSLLVCTVGIINAQLMAVTERFREIGTMKCLGALDSLVLRLFLIEAAVQGAFGAVAGIILGLVSALLMGMIRFGFAAVTSLHFSAVCLSIVTALGIGCLLSLVGVAYPAWVASRMQPVEAMRAQD